ncbi:hypothetical protein [Adhaeribacter rhizoryzae]|uniref:Uncharacterized protein n=1 Tax=Adhaeribacter rhizoryzae TaxID=2607907 RepID=A0A5M6D1Y0_9BACT|nr:hypothetical protein [Adhaeribacter rhizoryzae]KAA5539659.1 hypothetical protein F0145_24030 [Adhaeribacter rhizoryzae]
MIKVKHPDESCNQMQEAFLAKCPIDERRFHELLFTHGNISYRYHQEARNFEPTEKDYEEWLGGLPENIRQDMQRKGFAACKGILSFTRYVNELRLGHKFLGQGPSVQDMLEVIPTAQKGNHPRLLFVGFPPA